MKVRMKFRKNGAMRFVGHLDLMRYFQKAMRRAGLDLAYSEGFHPHPILSFALPLGLGLTSDGEYLDVELHTSLSKADAMRAMNREMAEGMEITDYVFLPDDAPNAMSAVAAADYLIYFKHEETFTQDEIADGIRSYYEKRDSIPVTKQSKKSERVIDLKPLLYRMSPCENGRVSSVTISDAAFGVSGTGFSNASSCCDRAADSSSLPLLNALLVPPCEPEYVLSDFGSRKGFFLRLSAGSTENIRPELVLEDYYRFLGKEYDPKNLQIHRLELYQKAEGEFWPLSFLSRFAES